MSAFLLVALLPTTSHAVELACEALFQHVPRPPAHLFVGVERDIPGLSEIVAESRVASALRRLSKKYRAGWKKRKIEDTLGETVLAHSRKVAAAALLIGATRPELDRTRMALMAYFHDLAEYIVTDFTPSDVISKDHKHHLERLALLRLGPNKNPGAAKILALWEEYEAQITPESRLVMQLDKLDAAIQAFEYEKLGYDVSEFFPYTTKKLHDPQLVAIFKELQLRQHPERNAYSLYFDRLMIPNQSLASP